ncbi:hypothetical protein BRADI_1g52730v3 [Brachypodium distachyon]|uniref:RING-type domain-containing protein n=1 Tax=Brachypodium distachyon TaxID=15368 RepID=A0A2K2DR51_BRADI|nr:hypothetical protein BRADI_1g52730v3 [Brachypodium distachyon]
MAKPHKIPKPPSPPRLLRSSAPAKQDKSVLIMGVSGNSSYPCSSHVGERDDTSNTTTLLSDFTADGMQGNPNKASSSLADVKLECAWSSVQAFVVDYIASEDLDLGSENEAVESNGFQYAGWTELRDITLYGLHVFFTTAVETISHEGYSQDAVIHAIRDSTLCYQFDGPITNISDRARALLKNGRQVDSSLVSMSGYGNEQSKGLVVNYQNINEPSGGYCCSHSETPGGAVLSHSEQVEIWRAALSQFPERMWSNVLTDYIAFEKSTGGDQVSSSGQLDKSSTLTRTVVTQSKKAAKGTSSKRILKESRSMRTLLESASSTSTGTSAVANTKRVQSPTSFSTMPLSNLSLVKRIDASTVVSTHPIYSPVKHSSSASRSGKAATKHQTKADALVRFSLPNTPADGFEFEFSHDGMWTNWVPKDRKEEMALDLIRRLGELKLEVKVCADWAHERLQQSIKRLEMEKPVLVSLRKEKETLECGVLNRERLDETQRAVDSTSDELERAHCLELELTGKIALSAREKDSAKLQDKQSVASLAEILRKGKETLERLKSMETEKILLQEELAAEQSNLCKILENLEQAKGYKDILMQKKEEGEKMSVEAMKQVDLARNELERAEMSARTECNNVMLNAENENKRLKASAKELEELVKGLEFDLASGRRPERAMFMGRPPGFRPDSVLQERECQMCLDEEVSVVFLPCRHQSICVSCNQLHRDKGITECPTCRSPVERRICARFADS